MIELCNVSDYKRDAFFYLFARHITKNRLLEHDQIDNMLPHKGILIYQMVRSNPKMVVTVVSVHFKNRYFFKSII